jgi:hypothetical protein
VAIFLGVVSAVGDHKHTADREADQVDYNLDLASVPFVE